MRLAAASHWPRGSWKRLSSLNKKRVNQRLLGMRHNLCLFGKIGGLSLIQAPPRSELVIQSFPPIKFNCTPLKQNVFKKTNYHITYIQLTPLRKTGVFPDGTRGEEPACQWKRHRRCRFDPWVGKIPGGMHGNPLQYSSLENSMNRGAWRATVHSISESKTWLKWLSMQAEKQQRREKHWSCQEHPKPQLASGDPSFLLVYLSLHFYTERVPTKHATLYHLFPIATYHNHLSSIPSTDMASFVMNAEYSIYKQFRQNEESKRTHVQVSSDMASNIRYDITHFKDGKMKVKEQC